MSSVSTPRVIGKYSGTSPGPLLICLAGIHGNEPAGVHALGKLFEELEADNTSIRGTIIGIAGNCAALNVSQRFIDRDLNRAWQSEPPQQYDNSHEAAEKKEIVGLLQELLDGYSGSAFFLDLHTSSAGGAPFSCIGDTIRNRKFGRSFPTPKILGLEEQIDGALLEFLNNLGLTTMGFEGGQHQDLDAIDNCRAAIWCGMVGAGCISAKHHLAKSAYDLLAERTKGSPPWVGIRYRHAIAECDEFKMRPGLQNFDRVEANYLLATHNSEAVHSFYKARVILPLYQ
ncbi:MAG: succinylglutamate desuccinylase/aspartoacylase family protein, partial [Planctomycetota bacterium]|nr:succinylglutamate desuccinylase/aspartoacylase family protein [Planctomycetota bacterium]